MDPGELLELVASRLRDLEIPFFVTGSMATIAYGEPRFTNDIDVVVQIRPHQIRAFVDAFATEEFYLAEETVTRAVEAKGSFNLIHPSSGLKVDFMLPEDNDFNRSRFERTKLLSTGSADTFPFASPEDVILKKLEYFREGGSQKHLRDIKGVLEVTDEIDRSYLRKWAGLLGLKDQLVLVLGEEA